jgi:hypothetical protein
MTLFSRGHAGAALALVGAVALQVGNAGSAAAGPNVTQITPFTSPSGKIGCQIDPAMVRCDITERTWSAPPRPADCPSVTGYGQGLTLQAGGRARFVCAGDTAMTQGNPLAYGDWITAGVLRCDSAESGITCRDVGTGHGFTVARQSYNLF